MWCPSSETRVHGSVRMVRASWRRPSGVVVSESSGTRSSPRNATRRFGARIWGAEPYASTTSVIRQARPSCKGAGSRLLDAHGGRHDPHGGPVRQVVVDGATALHGAEPALD